MTFAVLALILGCLGASGLAFIWLAVRMGGVGMAHREAQLGSVEKAAEDDVEHIFNNEFREELRNRGRLHFEKIIGENAMFLQQDLRLTTSQLNEYMKAEITKKLKEEFAKYEESIMDAKQLAIESIQKTNAAIDEERQTLSTQLEKEMADQKTRLISHFEQNMADIINHYVLAAVGNQIDLSDQLEFILRDLEENKQAILEDIQSGV
ncbi:MAG: hypothetical protein ABIR37_03755 [Candidatus Saccharimonadales bacterium]